MPAAAMGRGMGSIAFACLQLIPIIIYVCYAYTLLFVGAYALAEDYAVSDHACGKTYHLWKFCCVNSLLCFFTCLSYCVWRGGGEGARARAMVLTMLYFGFFMWGLLLWQRMSPACANIFNKQFHTLYVFHHICTCTNGLFFFLFCLHESFLARNSGEITRSWQRCSTATTLRIAHPWTFRRHMDTALQALCKQCKPRHLRLDCLHNFHMSTKKLCRVHPARACLRQPPDRSCEEKKSQTVTGENGEQPRPVSTRSCGLTFVH